LDISLDFVVDAARRRLATLTPEVAGYVVLLAARELELRPRDVSMQSLALAEGGEVRVREAAPATPEAIESSLRGVLATLVALAPSPAPAISAVAERNDGVGLAVFTAELAAALIPINHAAAQRALARLYRESQRARLSGRGDEVAAHAAAATPDVHPAPQPSDPRAQEGPPVPELEATEPTEADVLAVRAPVTATEPGAPERPREPEPLEIDVDLSSYPPAAAAPQLVLAESLVPSARASGMTPAPSERFPEPFALAAPEDAPVSSERFPEPFALAALEDAPAPSGAAFERVEVFPAPVWRSEPDEPVTGAPEPPMPPEVVVPVPIIGLAARERAVVVPMAIIEATAPVAHVAESRLSEPTSANEDEPPLVEPPQSIDTLSQSGFARVSWPSLPPANADLGIEDCRSDVQQLLAAFIADARSEKRMTRDLRRLLGLEPASSERAHVSPS
jgi:hypothetical protein